MKKSLMLLMGIMMFGLSTVHAEDDNKEDTQEETTMVEDNDSDENKDKDPFDPESYETVYEENMYKVGVDIPAGEYKVYGIGEDSYFHLMNDVRGEDYVTGFDIDTFVYVDIEDDQYFELIDCFAVSVDDIWPVEIEDDKIGSGVYKVGFDIEEGEYKVKALGEDAYVGVFKDANAEEQVTGKLINKSYYVELQDGEYLELYDAEMELK